MTQETERVSFRRSRFRVCVGPRSIVSVILIASLAILSCSPKRETVLDGEELLELASRKLKQNQERGLKWRITHPKQRKQAMELLNQLLAQYPESRRAKEAQMLLADVYFDDEKFEEAEAEYTVFLRFYPSAEAAQKAQFRLALTHHRRMADYDRDQTQTHKTIDACEQYYARFPEGELK